MESGGGGGARQEIAGGEVATLKYEATTRHGENIAGERSVRKSWLCALRKLPALVPMRKLFELRTADNSIFSSSVSLINVSALCICTPISTVE